MNTTSKFRVGHWLPADSAKLSQHIQGIKAYVADNPSSFNPAVTALNDYVVANPEISALANAMFTEVNPKYDHSVYGSEVKDWTDCVTLLNGILAMPSSFNDTGAVGFPINALFDWAMGTPSGRAFFMDAGVNQRLMGVLNVWGDYLTSAESLVTVVTDNQPIAMYAGYFATEQYNWLSDKAMIGMASALTPGVDYSDDPNAARKVFIKSFVCDPDDHYYGYKSWDDFFTREFNPGVRPVAQGDTVIANACESGPYRIAYNVPREAIYYAKGQPYSLLDIFNEKEGASPLTDKYEGGTIYQAFLSAESFHQWHCPVDGRILKVYNTIDQQPFNSTYYAEMPPASPTDEDPAGPNESQAFIASVAARAVIEIHTDIPGLGDMCVVPIGMAECSTCEVTAAENDPITKGNQLGMFHFGGSTHLLIFKPGTTLLFDFHHQKPGLNASNIPVNARIAEVVGTSLPYPSAADCCGLRIGNAAKQSNSAALLFVVPEQENAQQLPAYPINVGNAQGQYLWGVDNTGCVNTQTGTPQPAITDAYANLHVDFPTAGGSGYVIGEDPNSKVCAALKIVVPDGAQTWPIIVADSSGTTRWGIDSKGQLQTANPAILAAQSAAYDIAYPHCDGGSNALMIGDMNKTLGCYGGLSIIVPDDTCADIYAIAVVDDNGELLWGVDNCGKEVSGAGL